MPIPTTTFNKVSEKNSASHTTLTYAISLNLQNQTDTTINELKYYRKVCHYMVYNFVFI